MVQQQAIDAFLAGTPHAVVGASRDRTKYGNRVLRAFLQRSRDVFPVNPYAARVEGLVAYRQLSELPESVHGCAVITPPEVTEAVVDQAIDAGIKHLWLQPGAESPEAVYRAEQAGCLVVWGGPCLLVVLGYRGD